MPRLLCSEELDENLLRDVLRLVGVGEEQATRGRCALSSSSYEVPTPTTLSRPPFGAHPL